MREEPGVVPSVLGCGWRRCWGFLAFGGARTEGDLLMVTCTQSWFPGVPGVELFCGEAGIVEVFCWIPGLIVFRRVAGQLGSVLEFVTVEVGVDDFF